MSFFAFIVLFLCFLLCVACSAVALGKIGASASGRNTAPAALPEKGNLVLLGGLTLLCFILAAALAASNFSFLYVVEHTDRSLHIFYRITALWAGQEGALLFWAWCASLCAVLFQRTRSYKTLAEDRKLWFWTLFFAIMGFFGLLLTGWNNPFIEAVPPPADGHGLNPLLQHPGMIFHPPLLFMGYGAFTVPCCLALAFMLPARLPQAGKLKKRSAPEQGGTCPAPGDASWASMSRPFILVAWLLLGAGILLGAWWSYMELGWGGYWAWDPVENSSLVPWLVATAYLHTALVENHNGKLGRTNAFLMALVTVSAFFSTYLVRSGVVRSVHAFGESPVGTPLLVFVVLFFAFTVFVCVRAPRTGEYLGTPFTREGLLVCTAWVFLALGLITIMGTLWPVLSSIWSDKPVGLEAAFYNTVCLPLFTVIAVLLALCPWVGWQGRLAHKKLTAIVLVASHGAGAGLVYIGLSKFVPMVSAAAAVGIIVTICLIFSALPGLLKSRAAIASHGVHFGFALIVLGVAFSGPYKTQENVVLKPGQSVQLGEYALTLVASRGGDSHDHEYGLASGVAHPDHAASPPAYIYSEAVLRVVKNGTGMGEVKPQLRRYAKYPGNAFSEVDTLFSWGNELYCSLLGMEVDGTATVQISLNPLVNWIWLGSVVLCLFPLLGLVPRRRNREGAEPAPAAENPQTS